MAENREQIIRTEYSEIMQKSYIDYAMSVIIARAAGCAGRIKAGTAQNSVRYARAGYPL